MKDNKLTLPIAIIVAGILIGGAIIFTRNVPTTDTDSTKTPVTTSKTANIKPVTSADHILGNPDAKVVVVEYADTECPLCKTFAETMEKVIDTYGKDGTVAWVYRSFPLTSIHSRSPKETEATECVNKLAGNDMYWKYLKKIYEVTPGNNGLDPAQLPILAAGLGVDKKAFQTCLDSNTFTEKVQSDINDAIAAGAQGTPYTVILPKNQISDSSAKKINDMFVATAIQYGVSSPDKIGYITSDKKVVLNGNMPYELVQQIIEAIIS